MAWKPLESTVLYSHWQRREALWKSKFSGWKFQHTIGARNTSLDVLDRGRGRALKEDRLYWLHHGLYQENHPWEDRKTYSWITLANQRAVLAFCHTHTMVSVYTSTMVRMGLHRQPVAWAENQPKLWAREITKFISTLGKTREFCPYEAWCLGESREGIQV